jgi:hypothetical protein
MISATPSLKPLPTGAALSRVAEERLRHPRTRGVFAPIEAARRQLGLLAVADDQGQARIGWLIDLDTKTVADARFLAFGDLASHPIADAFTELLTPVRSALLTSKPHCATIRRLRPLARWA